MPSTRRTVIGSSPKFSAIRHIRSFLIITVVGKVYLCKLVLCVTDCQPKVAKHIVADKLLMMEAKQHAVRLRPVPSPKKAPNLSSTKRLVV
jgi:hypothetical protein